MDEPSSLVTAGKLLAVLALVLANGFFVAAEFSLVAMRRSRVEQLLAEGHPLAPAVQRAVQHLDTYLAATQLGITMASLGLGWIGEPALAGLIEPAFRFLPQMWAQVGSHTLAAAGAFALITALHIVLGELTPKSLALQHTERTAMAVGKPLGLFLTVFRPAILLLNSLGNLVLRLIGLRPATGEALVHSVGELKLLVSASHEAGLLGEEAEGIVERAFELDDFAARQVMVPRVEMVCLPVDTAPQVALEVAAAQHHTRLPVYEGDVDNVVGMVHIVDLVTSCQSTQAGAVGLRTLMRPVLLVPETIRVDALLTQMKIQRAQMAVLVDEYGGTAGLVTIHDLVERLVGPVLDRQEVTQDAIEPLPDGALLGGLALVHDVNERFGLDINDDEFDTVGGFMLARLGRVPEAGDVVLVDGYVFRVESMDGKRVASVRLTKAGAEPEAAP